ncbi:hypothetical protein GGU45_004305 [Niabella hirudinis]
MPGRWPFGAVVQVLLRWGRGDRRVGRQISDLRQTKLFYSLPTLLQTLFEKYFNYFSSRRFLFLAAITTKKINTQQAIPIKPFTLTLK